MIKIADARRKAGAAIRLAGWATLALLAVIIVAHWKSSQNEVVGSPARDQVTGTWVGDYALDLVLRPDGTFTSDGLPSRVGTAAPELDSTGSSLLGVWPARGTWTIGPGHLGSSAESVIFTVDCRAPHVRCAGHPRTFELQLETDSPQGGGGPALFYFLDRTHHMDNQYPFLRGH